MFLYSPYPLAPASALPSVFALQSSGTINIFIPLEAIMALPWYCDNKSCITIAKSTQINFKYSKHIDIRYMFIKDKLKDNKWKKTTKEFDVLFIRSAENLADIFTKQKPKGTFRQLKDVLKGAGRNEKDQEFEIDRNLTEILNNDDRQILMDSEL